MAFTLTELWEKQTAGRLTHRAFEELGGIEGALACYADGVVDKLAETQRERVRRVFVQLVKPGESTADTRRLANRTELEPADWALVQRLADERLVVTDRDPAGRETAEVVHEALIQRWPRLRSWMAEDREFRIWQERLRERNAFGGRLHVIAERCCGEHRWRRRDAGYNSDLVTCPERPGLHSGQPPFPTPDDPAAAPFPAAICGAGTSARRGDPWGRRVREVRT